jgi:hypothetical protein
MTIDELPAYLEKKGIRSSVYHLHGTGIGDEHCIEKGPRGWHVFYHERGTKNDEAFFQKEEEAVALLVRRLESDPLCFHDPKKRPNKASEPTAINPPPSAKPPAPLAHL